MAVSNSIGSNVFDILIGLAFPWFLETTIINPGSKVRYEFLFGEMPFGKIPAPI